MTNTKHKFYLKIDNITKVRFEITAKRFIEDYTQPNNKSYFLFTQLKSHKVTEYQQGTLYLKNSHLSFNQAVWSQGQLVLTEASGIINHQRFNSPEIRFNKDKMQVTAKSLTLSSSDRTSRQLNFQQQVEAVTFPYQKITFLNHTQIQRID